MEKIVFDDFYDLADCIIDKTHGFEYASVICHYEYAAALLHELIKKDCTVLSVDLHDYMFNGYGREYIVGLSSAMEIIIEPIYWRKEDGHSTDGYIYHESSYIYVHQDCNSEVLKHLEGDHKFEFSVCSLDDDEEDEDCSDVSTLSEGQHISYGPDGNIVGFQKTWSNDVDGCSSYTSFSFYSEDPNKIREFAKDVGVKLE